jgi:hypothetical protein
MKKLTVLGAALACLLLGSAVAAASSLPAFRSHLIVPNHSLGGVTLNSSAAAAARELGVSGAHCSAKKGCAFVGAGESEFSVLFAGTVHHPTPFVVEIAISTGTTKTGAHSFDSPFADLKTSAGIGLGSTAKAVKAAYPHATGSASQGVLSIVGHGELATEFIIADGRVTEIQMHALHLG